MTSRPRHGLRLERLGRLEQFERCVTIQRETWNYSASELFPRRAFLLAEKLGGHVLGAFDGDTMVAFNLAYPGYRNGNAYLHSQMLAVLPEFRNSGLGQELKRMQREIALCDGFKLIEWTFDPLEIKNAFFNLHRLGAMSRRYVRDFYGPSSSPLQGGLPTDRLYAEWWIASERVERALAGFPPLQTGHKVVQVPAEIYAWKADGDSRAAEVQSRVRTQLELAFAEGLAALNYSRLPDGSGVYELSTAPSSLNFTTVNDGVRT